MPGHGIIRCGRYAHRLQSAHGGARWHGGCADGGGGAAGRAGASAYAQWWRAIPSLARRSKKSRRGGFAMPSCRLVQESKENGRRPVFWYHGNAIVLCDAIAGVISHGGVAELAYAADLKSAAARLVGSSPTAPTRTYNIKTRATRCGTAVGLEPMRWFRVKKTVQWTVFSETPDRACEGGVGGREASA